MEEEQSRFLKVAADVWAADKLVPVERLAPAAPGDLIYNPRTGECVRVSSLLPGGLNCARGVGGEARDMDEGDELIVIGSAEHAAA